MFHSTGKTTPPKRYRQLFTTHMKIISAYYGVLKVTKELDSIECK
jgi:hypothetical protein